jgi:hypothetical protein
MPPATPGQLNKQNEWRTAYRAPDGSNWCFAPRTLSFIKEEISELLKDLIRRVDLARCLELSRRFFGGTGLVTWDFQGRLLARGGRWGWRLVV